MVGKTVSHYRILEKLGSGGMGVVYKAEDTKLGRTIALKVLPPERVADPNRKRRFIQEARAASALNHPNIITIHDIDEAEGVHYIAMEYVQGKTLDRLIARHGLRVSEALKYAVQMAAALAKAHSAGIVHRDLKPTNVMVTDDGLVKVLDFGLAKLTEAAPTGDAETAVTVEPTTEEGTIVGTVGYMSPEQAEGKPVDARSDIFSFGSVLYEMLTGQRAFQGETKASTIAAILREEPKPLSQAVQALPREVERIVKRCLRKDPGHRVQHMDDLKVALEELKEESDSGELADAVAVAPLYERRPWFAGHRPALQGWLAAAVVIAVGLAVAAWLFHQSSRNPAPAPEVVPLTSYVGAEDSPSFSPDGNQVAFSWNGEKQDNTDIYIMLIGSPSPVRLTTDPADDVGPAFSPDGRSIGFFRISKDHRTFIVIPSIGGPERIVAEIVAEVAPAWGRYSFAWFPNGKCVVTDGLALLSTESGEMRSLTSPPSKLLADSFPAVSPDGRTIAFSRATSPGAADIYLLDLTEDFKPKGEPRRLTSLKGSIVGSAWTPNGREIIFGSYESGKGGNLWKIPASGATEPEQLPFSPEEAFCPAISGSGKRLAYARVLYDPNIWRLSLSGPGIAAGPPTRFIASTRAELSPQYSPDGKRIAFESDRSGVYGIWVCDADGSHAVELFSRAGAAAGTARWSPDGQRIAFDFNPEGNPDIYVVRASGGTPIRLTTDSAYDVAPSWSRDGKWVYFTSIRTGRYETWKVPADGGEAVQVTKNGGGTAFESLDGKSIYYIKGNDFSGGLWKMPVSGGEESPVLPSVIWRAFYPVNEGIYFIPEPGVDGKFSIQFLSFATGKVKTVTPISKSFEGLSVSPDGRCLLFTQMDDAGSDLMLVENFR